MAAKALLAAGVPMTMLNFKPGADIPQNDHSMAAHVSEHGPCAINLFCLTGLKVGRYHAERGSQQFNNRYNIGYWPWELAHWPAEWAQLVHLVDEVWVSTRHTLQAVAALCEAANKPVHLMPMAVAVALVPVARRGGRTRVRQLLPLDAQAAWLAGQISDAAIAQGRHPGFADVAIAALAQHAGLLLLTRNLKHLQPLGVACTDPLVQLPA